MGSALAMWAYHRRLSMEANRIVAPTETDPQIKMDKPERKRRMRSDSESSVPPEDRRVSIEPATEESEDEGKQDKKEETHQKGHRRFSLDFLFNKKGKKQKTKEKRSNSIAVQETDDQYRAHRYPGIENNDFSFFYFI